MKLNYKKRFLFLAAGIFGLFPFAGCFSFSPSNDEIILKINSILSQYETTLQFQSLVLYNSMAARNIWSLYNGFNDDDRYPKYATPFQNAYQPSYIADNLVYSQPWSPYNSSTLAKPRNFSFEVAKLGSEVSDNVYSAEIKLDQPNPQGGEPKSQDNQVYFWLNFNTKYMLYESTSYQANTVFNKWFSQTNNPINQLDSIPGSKGFQDVYNQIINSLKNNIPPIPNLDSFVRVDKVSSEDSLNLYLNSGFIKEIEPDFSYTESDNGEISFKFLNINIWYKMICVYTDFGLKYTKPMFINVQFHIVNNKIVDKTLIIFSNPGSKIEMAPHREWITPKS